MQPLSTGLNNEGQFNQELALVLFMPIVVRLQPVHLNHGFADAVGYASDMTRQSFWFNKGYLEHILGL